MSARARSAASIAYATEETGSAMTAKAKAKKRTPLARRTALAASQSSQRPPSDTPTGPREGAASPSGGVRGCPPRQASASCA